jgi:hypothetical protein
MLEALDEYALQLPLDRSNICLACGTCVVFMCLCLRVHLCALCVRVCMLAYLRAYTYLYRPSNSHPAEARCCARPGFS